jgi:hypothetical protein
VAPFQLGGLQAFTTTGFTSAARTLSRSFQLHHRKEVFCLPSTTNRFVMSQHMSLHGSGVLLLHLEPSFAPFHEARLQASSTVVVAASSLVDSFTGSLLKLHHLKEVF